MTKILLASLSAIALTVVICSSNLAQDDLRYRYNSTLPPGQVGKMQLLRRSAMQGYAQPVQLIAPEGARISVFEGGGFQEVGISKATVGMLIGQTYRIKVTQIPNRPGVEVFPSVEVINRLYPPPGLALKFPVQVHLAQSDLNAAAEGAIVTRVVYLEHPEEAMPFRQQRDDQPYFDVSPGRDPLKVAQQLGRPMVIVRAGSITPDGVDLHQFTFGSPPVQLFQTIGQVDPGYNQVIPQSDVTETIGDQFQQ